MTSHWPFSFGIGLLVWASLSASLPAQNDDPLTDRQLDFFEQEVRPLLAQRCLECHSGKVDPPAGGLRLDRRSGWQRGGELGPAIVPGQPDQSLLVEAIEPRSDRLQMPPDGRLSPAEIATLRRWIEAGAPDPRADDDDDDGGGAAGPTADAEPPHWAFQPLHSRAPDASDMWEDGWASNPIDRFWLRHWRDHGLSHAAQADRRTILRRVTFDLTGLPPTPAEIDQFLRDRRPDAYARVVERLLASPRYGERWGRFWLDVARYADSNGSDENIAHGHAWRYRDYVIRAFNADKPYDEFVREQLAGDLLPASEDPAVQRDRWIATGFFALGPKVLAEVDETKMEMDILDEQVETVGRAFLALTFGCARCHDHKFDPVSTEDYYALAGIFKSTQTMEHFTKIARWHEVSLALPDQQAAFDAAQAHVKQLEADLAETKRRLETGQKAATSGGGKEAAETCQSREQTVAALERKLAEARQQIPELPLAMGVRDYPAPTDLPIHIRGSHLTLGDVVPRRTPPALAAGGSTRSMPPSASGRRELSDWLVGDCRHLTARVMVNRLWRWHFGQGLVRSTDNFGRLAAPPVNADLLDWLAARLIEENWSLKAIQRLILSSQTYQLSSDAIDASQQVDPGNIHHWRANVRRLEAEAIRDSWLAISGQLDPTMGGSLLHVKNREFLFDHTSKDGTRYDVPRRSIYLPVIRNHLYDLFQLFDYVDESVTTSDRATTTVAPQALFLLNSELVHEAAESFATRLREQFTTDMERLVGGYQLAFGRPPTAAETERDLRYLARFDQQWRASSAEQKEAAAELQRRVWTLLCQTWLASNELIYVR